MVLILIRPSEPAGMARTMQAKSARSSRRTDSFAVLVDIELDTPITGTEDEGNTKLSLMHSSLLLELTP